MEGHGTNNQQKEKKGKLIVCLFELFESTKKKCANHTVKQFLKIFDSNSIDPIHNLNGSCTVIRG